MDDNRFDSLTRQVGAHTDRRTMIKTGIGGTLALLGLAGFASRGEARNNKRTGFDGDPCETNDDCRDGLTCEGARVGIAPGFPTPIPVPIVNGKAGRCRYKKSCGGGQGDACQRNGDCCNGQNLTCDNNRCKHR